MRKKLLFFGVGSFIVLLGVIGFTQYRNSFQKLSINIINPNASIQVSVYKTVQVSETVQKTGGAIQTISRNETVSLKKGIYALVPVGDNVDTTPFIVTLANTPVHTTVDIPYTTAYLSRLLTGEASDIHTTILATYPSLMQNYTLNPGQLFKRGEWYGMTLTSTQDPEIDSYTDTLRILMQKKNGVWTILSSPPEISLSQQTYPTTPVDILRAINKM